MVRERVAMAALVQCLPFFLFAVARGLIFGGRRRLNYDPFFFLFGILFSFFVARIRTFLYDFLLN